MMQRTPSIQRAAAALGAFAVVYGLAPLVLASPAATEAAEGHGAHGAHAAPHGITLFNWPSAEDPRIGLAYLLINFVVLVLLLNKLLFRNLVKSNVERHETVKRELEQATQARATAESVLSEYGRKIDALTSEKDAILKAARESAESERRRILAEAEAEAAKIVAAARAAGEREAAARRGEVEAAIVDAALDRARVILGESFSDADQRRSVDAFAGDLANTSLQEAVR